MDIIENNQQLKQIIGQINAYHRLKTHRSFKDMVKNIHDPFDIVNTYIFGMMMAIINVIIWFGVLAIIEIIRLKITGIAITETNWYTDSIIALESIISIVITYGVMKAKTNWINRKLTQQKIMIQRQVEQLNYPQLYLKTQNEYLQAIDTYRTTPTETTELAFNEASHHYRVIRMVYEYINQIAPLNFKLTSLNSPAYIKLQSKAKSKLEQHKQKQFKTQVKQTIWEDIDSIKD